MRSVVVLDAVTLRPCWPNAKVLKLDASLGGKLPEHPIETGVLVYDHFIENPNEIALELLLSGPTLLTAYEQIKRYYTQRRFVTVQGRADTWPRMLIKEWPHDETPERFDSVTMHLKLHEIRQVQDAERKVVNAVPAKQSVVAVGPVQQKEPSPPQGAKKLREVIQIPSIATLTPEMYKR